MTKNVGLVYEPYAPYAPYAHFPRKKILISWI